MKAEWSAAQLSVAKLQLHNAPECANQHLAWIVHARAKRIPTL